jgi:hypothetical protein
MSCTGDAKRKVEFYQRCKGLENKLRATYNESVIQRDEIRADENPKEEPHGKR